MSYTTFAYLTNNEQKNWFSDMSNQAIHTINFKRYIINLSIRTFFRMLKIIRVPSFVSKCNAVIESHLTEIPATTGIVIVAKKEKKFLLRILDVLEKDLQVICWFWDSISSGYAFIPDISKFKRVKFCSFDILDCKKYGFTYIEQFYYDNLQIPQEARVEQDVFYISNDRGRIDQIHWINEQLTGRGLKCNIRVVRDDSSQGKEDSLYVLSGIPYTNVLKEVSKSRMILEVICNGQTGPSLRVMESIFFRKKLITTNKAIRQYDFFHPSNIYIVEDTRLEGLQNFLESEYVDLPDSILQKYKISHWINRLDEI